MCKFFNKGLKEEEKKEGLLKRLKNVEDKNEEQPKTIDVKNGRIDGDEAKIIFKTLEDMESSKFDYSKLLYRSGDNEYFDFTRFRPLLSVYLKLVNGSIGINVVKLKLK